MIATNRIVRTAVGQLGRTAVGILVIMLVVGAVAPMPAPEARMESEPGDLERPVDTVALTVPDGLMMKSLTITDGSGHELATLTSLRTGGTTVVMRQHDGAAVSCWFNGKDRVILELTGTVWRTQIEMNRDGTAKSVVRPKPDSPAHGETTSEWSSLSQGITVPLFLTFFSV